MDELTRIVFDAKVEHTSLINENRRLKEENARLLSINKELNERILELSKSNSFIWEAKYKHLIQQLHAME